MTIKFSTVCIYFFLFGIFIFEGLGLPSGRLFSRYFICIFPGLLFAIDFWDKKTIKIPLKASLLFIIFLFTTVISTIPAVNVQTAFEHQLYYFGVFLFFLYVFNHKSEVSRVLPNFILGSTIIIFIYGIFINYMLPEKWATLAPLNQFQFVYMNSSLYSHHSFGAFILLPLIFIFNWYWNKPRKVSGIVLAVFVILLLLSFLRSAYLAFGAVVIMNFISSLKIRKYWAVPYSFMTGLILIPFIFSLLIISNFSFNIPVISNINNFLVEHVEMLRYKTLSNGRAEFARQAFEAIKQRPVIGFGSYNFHYAAMRFADSYALSTGTSHNIFLDIIVENGLLGGLTFIALILLFVIKGWKFFINGNRFKKSIYGVFVGLFVLFLLGHYHKMYFLFVFFFLMAGLIYEEKNTEKDTAKITFGSSYFLFLIMMVLVISQFFFKTNNFKAAVFLYPLSTQSNQALISEYYDKKLYGYADIQIKKYYYLYPEDPLALDFIGNYYERILLHTEAVKYYKLALQYSPHDVTYLYLIYNQMELMKQDAKARKFVEQYVIDNKIYITDNRSDRNSRWFYDWCEEKKIKCEGY
jgi:O-antigen ligase